MKYYYLKNLRSSDTLDFTAPDTLQYTKPKFKNKASYREWCSDSKTDHVFYSCAEGRAPARRISNDNPVNKISGIVADYDAGVVVDWSSLSNDLASRFRNLAPTWYSETESGYLRLVWEFTNTIPIAPDLYPYFAKAMEDKLKLKGAYAGFDETSLKANQYFELGTRWTQVNAPLPADIVDTVLASVINKKPPTTTEVSIPMDVIAKEVDSRFPNRWSGDFEVGARGPLFWIDDGIEREGCQVVEDGVVCYSDRAGQGFMCWSDLFGRSFVKDYEEKKISDVVNEYWFNGRSFYKLLHNRAVPIPREQLVLELRQRGFSSRAKKNQPLSEVESAILTISNHNRIDEIAPVVFSGDRVVSYNGSRILNCANLEPVMPSGDGAFSRWPFLHKWLDQLFSDSSEIPTLEYFYAWLSRIYKATIDKKFMQGHALLLVGPTGRGKSLLSNIVVGGLLGGFADASDYLSGHTAFNKDLGRVPLWAVDDTVSASSFQDQRKATELLKRAVANPRVEYQAKYADALSIPWTGRVILSLNMDANSLSVIPSLDSSNRDKIMALRIADDSTRDFPSNAELEDQIASELPHFAKFLEDYVPSKKVAGRGRFGIKGYIDPTIADAAYDNSSRSVIAETVEIVSKRIRELDPEQAEWRGTVTELQVLYQDLCGRAGMSHSSEFLRRGLATMEESCKVNSKVRPVFSAGNGGGKLWTVDIGEKYDIGYQMEK